MSQAAEVLFEARDLVRTFKLPRTSLTRAPSRLQALRGVSLQVRRGETLGIVGESGSGKSTLVRLMLALDRPDSGALTYAGTDLVHARASELGRLRREVQAVFQDPAGALDPRMRVRDSILEPLRVLRIRESHQARLEELLDAVGLPRRAADRYPHEFSGGQRQRIAIARALAPRPRVLLADEPVSALDVSVRAQILNLLEDLRTGFDLTLVLVSHDLSVVRHMCDRVAVMYLGRIVETAPSAKLFGRPQHPYTRSLLASVPTLTGGLPRVLPGQVPSPTDLPPGCAFAGRCPLVFDSCLVDDPALRGSGDHQAACHLAFADG